MIDFSNAPLDQDQQPDHPRHDPAAINRHLIDTLEEWLPRLLPGVRKHPSEYRAGSVNGERGSSLSIARTGPRRGLWQDRASGQSGDPIALIRAALNTDFATALETAAEIARLPLRKTPPSQLNVRSSAENLAAAIRIIEASAPLTTDTLAHQYLVSTRGLAVPATQDLRFHHSLFHAPTKAHHPALVAIVRHHSGRIVGTHRTYLDPDRCDKIKIDPSRLSLGPIAGGAVWLCREPSSNSTLAVCEGIETGLAALSLFPSLTAIAATLSTSGLRNFEVPPATTRLLILADFDPVDPRIGQRPGTLAAEALQKRYPSIESAILYPDRPYKDFNDQLKQQTDTP